MEDWAVFWSGFHVPHSPAEGEERVVRRLERNAANYVVLLAVAFLAGGLVVSPYALLVAGVGAACAAAVLLLVKQVSVGGRLLIALLNGALLTLLTGTHLAVLGLLCFAALVVLTHAVFKPADARS